MRASLKSGFALEVFASGGPKSDRLNDFLALYLQHSPPHHRTNTNELVDFLEAPDNGRELYYFGLTHHGDPSGFAVLMYYPKHLVGVFDYIVIKPTGRGLGAFFEFATLIKEFLESKQVTFDYMLAEVLLNSRIKSSTNDFSLLIRVMRLIGFRVATIPYWAPDPGIVKHRDDCKSALLVFAQPDAEYIGPSDLNRLLRVMYFDHYFNWFRRYMTPAATAEYQGAINAALADTIKRAEALGQVKLNGGKNMDVAFAIEPKRSATFNLVGYLWFIAVPTLLSIVLAVAEAPALTVGILVAFTGVFAIALFFRGFRRWLSEFFRLGE